MVEVMFVGTGAAIGGPERTNAMLLVRGAGTGVLIDCGPTAFVQLQRWAVDPKDIRFLFLTHRHADHILGFPVFMLYRLQYLSAHPLTILAGETTARIVQSITRETYPELADGMDDFEWITVPESELSTRPLIDGLSLTSAPVYGPDHTPTLGVRLDFASGVSMTYSSDTAPSERVARLAAGTRLLVHESNFSERLSPDADSAAQFHSTARHAGEVAQQAKASILALVHLSHDYAGQEDTIAGEAREIFEGEVIVPRDGSVLYL